MIRILFYEMWIQFQLRSKLQRYLNFLTILSIKHAMMLVPKRRHNLFFHIYSNNKNRFDRRHKSTRFLFYMYTKLMEYRDWPRPTLWYICIYITFSVTSSFVTSLLCLLVPSKNPWQFFLYITTGHPRVEIWCDDAKASTVLLLLSISRTNHRHFV